MDRSASGRSRDLAVAASGLAFLAAALLAFVGALFALAAGAGFLVGGGDGVDAGPHDRARGLGCAPDHRARRADDGSDQTALEHQGPAEQGGEGSGAGEGLDHSLI